MNDDSMLAEQSTLGGMMLSRSVCEDVIDTLYAHDFYLPRHEIIFTAIAKLYGEGKPTDVVAVGDHLMQTGHVAQAGGMDYLHILCQIVTTPATSPYYAGIVHDSAVRRNIGTFGESMQQMSKQGGDVNTMVETARQRIDEIVGLRKQNITYVGDLIDEVIADAERPRHVTPTPWTQLTDLLGGGFRPGGLYTLAARPGIGKTAIALQIATALAAAGPVAFASLEMTKEELVRRIIAQGVQMPHHLLERGVPLPELWKFKITEWQYSAPHAIAIDDRASVTVADIRAFGRAVKRPAGRIGGMVIDYLQLMNGSGNNRNEIVSEQTRQCKIMAKELGCPVILLSQLNRESEKRMDKRPQLSDLRDSGAIEQDSDAVMMLYRDPDQPTGDPGGPPITPILDLDLPKHRHGPTGTVELRWEGSQMRAY